MATFKVEINTYSPAFGNDQDACVDEIIRVLERVTAGLRASQLQGEVPASDGNRAGWWALTGSIWVDE